MIAATEPPRPGIQRDREFPKPLATLAAGPLAKLDADRDGRVSILEVYRATVAEVAARFASDHRVPTEHAQIDDDGDGSGTCFPTPENPRRGSPLRGGLLLEEKRATAENAEDGEKRQRRDSERVGGRRG